ncbi:hypothetical protein NIES2130_12205 [Scytonema sp. HK-05]|nr:hypothetical protein NIES2130_12205 [Scytonema sp. HK-05]
MCHFRAGVPPALGKWRQATGVGFPPGETAVLQEGFAVSLAELRTVSRTHSDCVSAKRRRRQRVACPCLLLPSGEQRLRRSNAYGAAVPHREGLTRKRKALTGIVAFLPPDVLVRK